MKLALLFPPLGSFTHPPLSLPSLTAYLRSRGHEVFQCDIGIKCADRMLSAEYLRAAHAEIQARLAGIKAGSSAPVEKEQAKALFVADTIAPWTINNIEHAKEVLRCWERFRRPHDYSLAKNAVENAFSIVSARYYPFELKQNWISYGAELTLENLLALAGDETRNLFLKMMRDDVLPRVLPAIPPVVGISATYTPQLFSAFTLARIIKTLSPETLVVLGGSGVTPAEPRIRAHPKAFDVIDSYVFGEGEGALASLLDMVESNFSTANTLNKLYLPSDRRAGRAQKIAIANRAEREDFSALPTPDYEGLNLADYLAPEIMFLLSNGRGCYYRKCAFCTVSLAFNSGFKQRSRDKLFADLRALQTKHNARWLFFADDCIGPARCRELASFMGRLEQPIYWATEVRFEPGFTKELLQEMYRGGCRQLIFGNESGNQRVLDLMNKRTDLALSRRIMRDAREAGIAVSLQNVLGFPGETLEEAEDTVRFLIEEKEQIASYAISPFHLDEHSPIHQNPSAFGITSVREKNTGDLIPTYSLVLESGPSESEINAKYREALSRLSRVYRGMGFPLDGVLGAHALLHLVQARATGFDAAFGLPPVPEHLLDQTPVLKPSVRVRRHHEAELSVLLDAASGKRYVLANKQAAWLNLADGRSSIGQLAGPLIAGESPQEEGAELDRIVDFAIFWVELHNAGLVDLQEHRPEEGTQGPLPALALEA